MKCDDYPDFTRYRVGCDCGLPDHDLDIWVEVDDLGIGTLNFSHDTHTRLWRNRFSHPWLSWLNDALNRIEIALKVLITGHVTRTSDFVISKENLAALRTALDDTEKLCNWKNPIDKN